MSLFVTCEGPEGSGKTTQIRLLYEYLQTMGYPVVCTREPGGTPISEQIRTLLHDVQNTAMLATTEILLYSAARAQHVGQLIRPALEHGQIVISDRYAESTLAYQGYGRGLDWEALRAITRFATGGLEPNLVIYLDLDVITGLQRKWRDQQTGQGEWNRMDQLDVAFHQRVREGYLQMAAEDGAATRWMVIDANQSRTTIQSLIRERVLGLLQAAWLAGSPRS
jgi:dTMP kinase